MMVLYSNQIGWYAFEDEPDVVLLEEVLRTMERGYELSNWNKNKYIKDAKVQLLLKLAGRGRLMPIADEALSRDAKYPDFQDLKKIKNTFAGVKWEKEEHQVYLKSMQDEKA